MHSSRYPLLTGSSLLALIPALLAPAALAQDARATPEHLGTITLIVEGQENIEATGGAVVTAEDLAATAPGDVSELFARESAVTVSGGAGPSKRIHVFGMEQSNLAVSVDGVPQAKTAWHHTGSSVIDPFLLRRVEVEAGAAAADAGFAAAAGAVRYETLSAADLLDGDRASGGRASLGWGSNGRGLSTGLAGYGRAGGFDWLLYGHVADGRNYKAGNGQVMDGTAPALRSLIAKFGHEFETHRIELDYSRTEDNADRTVKMNMDLPTPVDGGANVAPLVVRNDTLTLRYTSTAPSAGWDPEATLYLSRDDYWRPDYLAGRANGDMHIRTSSLGGRFGNTMTFGPGSLTAGVDFASTDHSVDNYGATDRRYWNFGTVQVGAFVQGRFAFENGLDLSAGARLDHHRFDTWDNKALSDSGASLNATLSYAIGEGVEIFAGASETWLGYDLGEFALLHARNADFGVRDDFRASKATNYKIGVNFAGETFHGGITFFDTRLKNRVAYDTSASSPTYGLNSNVENRSRGVTLNAGYHLEGTRFGLSYTKADVTKNGAFALPDGSRFMPVSDVASLYVDHALPILGLKLGATAEWAGKLDDPALAAAGFVAHESYLVVNAYAEWTPQSHDNVTLRLGIDNLFDRSYYERSSYVQRTSGRIVDPHLAPGRTITLGAALTF